MYRIIILLACLVVSPLIADTIGKLEYQLPDQGKGWKVAKKFEGNKTISTTVIYVPTYVDLNNSEETFTAHVNNLSSKYVDQATLEKEIQSGIRSGQVHLTVLDTTPNSVLYTWSITHAGKVVAHFLTRSFSTADGTVMLSYQNEDADSFEKARPIWTKALNQAKLKQ